MEQSSTDEHRLIKEQSLIERYHLGTLSAEEEAS